MEATVYLKNVHISPKKLRFILPEIKKMTPHESLDHLYYSPKKGASIFYKAIKSAIDNAKYTLKAREDLLQFKLLTVEQGNALKRYRPGGRGTAKPYKKRYSHIKIVLVSTQPVQSVKKAEPVKVKKTESVKKKTLQINSDSKRVKSASEKIKDAPKK